MGKNKNKSNQQQYLKTDIDYDKLAEAIVKAHKKIKSQEEKETEDKRNAERQEWLKIIGCKDYPDNEKWLRRKRHEFKSNCAVLKSLFTFKRKDAKTPRLSFELMRLGAVAVYGLCEVLLYLFALLLSVSAVMANENIAEMCFFFAYGFVAVLFARIIRIARFEIDNIKDREMLNTIFSATMAFIGVILAVIALIVQLA